MSAIATHDSELDCQSALIQSPILNAGLHVGSIALGRDEAMFGSKLVAGSEWNQDETLCLVLSSENIRRSISVDVQSFFQVLLLDVCESPFHRRRCQTSRGSVMRNSES